MPLLEIGLGNQGYSLDTTTWLCAFVSTWPALRPFIVVALLPTPPPEADRSGGENRQRRERDENGEQRWMDRLARPIDQQVLRWRASEQDAAADEIRVVFDCKPTIPFRSARGMDRTNIAFRLRAITD